MPFSDLRDAIVLPGCSVSIVDGEVRMACGLYMVAGAFTREQAVTYWRQFGPLLKAAHQNHHDKHFGIRATMILITRGNAARVYCTDAPPLNPATVFDP